MLEVTAVPHAPSTKFQLCSPKTCRVFLQATTILGVGAGAWCDIYAVCTTLVELYESADKYI